MGSNQSSYKQILKATSLFGGVQVFNILITIIRTKFVAILLGPAGMGITGLLNITITFIGKLTNFGLGTSAVKNIAAAYGNGNIQRVSKVASILKRLVWATGILGSLLTFLLSSWLSEITFGNSDYTYSFIWISITLLFNQLSTGQSVLLRGMRKFRYLAQASMIGSIVGLITTVPLYYFFGEDGIVPGIVITSLSSLALTWYYANKVKLGTSIVSKEETLSEGKDMLRMGFLISLSGLITLGVSYLVRIFINNFGGLVEVGLYNAGFAILNSYVGMIFTSMSTDYYPRLAAVSQNNEQARNVINHQAEITLLIISPVILVFLVFIDLAVIILYSEKFVGVNEMIIWAAMGILFKTAGWAIAYIFLAKGNSRLFFWNELGMNCYMLIFNLIGYYFWGLEGVGVSFLISYVLYVIQVYTVSHKNYDFQFYKGPLKIFFFQLLLASICLFQSKMLENPYTYIFGSILIIISALYSFVELNKRIDLKSILNGFKNKFKK